MTIGDRLSGAAVGLFLVMVAVLLYCSRDWLYRIWRFGGSFLYPLSKKAHDVMLAIWGVVIGAVGLAVIIFSLVVAGH